MIKVQIFKGRGKGQVWRWRIVANNNKKIATSGEAFENKYGAQRAATNAVKSIQTSPIKVETIDPDEQINSKLTYSAG